MGRGPVAAGGLERALRAGREDGQAGEDKVRPRELADTGSRDVPPLEIEHGSPTEGYEGTRVDHSAQRRGGGVAARGARAAGRKAGERGGDCLWDGGRYEPFDRGFCAAAAAA